MDENRSIPPEIQSDFHQAREYENFYLQTNQIELLDIAARAWERILSYPSFKDTSADFRLTANDDAGRVFMRLYQAGGQIADLNHAIALWQEAVELIPPNSPIRPILLSNLGVALRARYTRIGNSTDLDHAINVYQAAAQLTPSDNLVRLVYLVNLGNGLRDRYLLSGNTTDLDQAIANYQEALSSTPPDAPERSSRLTSLGNGLRDRYLLSGNTADLDQAIANYQEALSSTLSNAPERSAYLNSLGNALRDRYLNSGSAIDLGGAIRLFREVVHITSSEWLNYPMYLNNLGSALRNRYLESGNITDLDEAIAIYENALAITLPEAPNRPSYLTNLSVGLRDRYMRTGNPADLNEVIRVSQEAILLTSPDSPNRAAFLNNLGNGLRDRYRRIGTISDLDEALHAYREAISLIPPGDLDRPSQLNNLAGGLHDQYLRTDSIADLNEAIRISQEAISLAPPNSPDRAAFLNNLGNSFRDRYRKTGTVSDLDEALHAYRESISLTPLSTPDRPTRLSNLGAALRDQYKKTKYIIDLDEAIHAYQEAVQLIPTTSPDRIGCLNNLGNGLRDRYKQTKIITDLDEAVSCYRQACELGSLASQEITLFSSRAWGLCALERQSWTEACQAFDFGLQASQRLFANQFSRLAKESWLTEARGLASRAAFAFAKAGDLSKALEILESGRARLLGETLERNRRDLERLAEIGYPDLLERYRAAGLLLDELQRLITTDVRPVDWQHQVETAQTDLDACIAEIRQVQGYETFLSSLSAKQIQQQAQSIPLVYITATPVGGLALLVTSKAIQPIWLEKLTDTVLGNKVQIETDTVSANSYLGAYNTWLQTIIDKQVAEKVWQAALDDILAWLWSAVMQPVVASLESQKIQQAVLIPGGLLGLLPLHAAWTDNPTTPTGRHYAMDTVCFTYAPSARAMQEGQEIASRARPDALLAIDNPDSSLENATYEVQTALFGFDKTLQLSGQEANHQTVTEAMPHYSVLHFATHGRANWLEPLQSSLRLADGELTLGELLDSRLPETRLAVLSACETGVLGTKLPDEVVSLPSGLMQAGVAGVVASLWAVQDISTAMLMAHFYELWRQDGLALSEALRQAQTWMRDTTDGEKAAYFQTFLPEFSNPRMPDESAQAFYNAVIFNDPNTYSFSNPFYWAAFTYSGV